MTSTASDTCRICNGHGIVYRNQGGATILTAVVCTHGSKEDTPTVPSYATVAPAEDPEGAPNTVSTTPPVEDPAPEPAAPVEDAGTKPTRQRTSRKRSA